MGQFLVIGMATYIVANKKKVVNAYCGFSSVEVFKDTLTKRFNAHGIYDVDEDDSEIRLTLKDSIAKAEWLPFLQAFYKLRYGDEDKEHIVSNLSEHGNLESWLDIANKKSYESYQADELYHLPIIGEQRDDYTVVYARYVILSLTGKIWMECYGKLFAFFSQLIRERLSEFSLSDGLLVDITD